MKPYLASLALLLLAVRFCVAEQKYPATGMVLRVDQPHLTLVVSCQPIPGYMDAMAMPIRVLDRKELTGIVPGMTVDFTLVVEPQSSNAEHVQIRRYESAEQDPLTARRLKLLIQISHSSDTAAGALKIGQTVQDFTLTDQDRRPIALSEFAGKVVAINFVYTSCALPNFCFRNSSNLSALRKRFAQQMGRQLVLLTVTFDPLRDRPDVLARYAKIWKADSASWHFLTGSGAEIQRVADMFGMEYFTDEGLMDHSLHTAIVDQRGKLVANIEGNQFTADQLGDLVQEFLNRGSGGTHKPLSPAYNPDPTSYSTR